MSRFEPREWTDVAKGVNGMVQHSVNAGGKNLYRVLWHKPSASKAGYVYCGLGMNKSAACELALRTEMRGQE